MEIFDPEFMGDSFSRKKGGPKQWKFENRNFIVCNSEIVSFDFTEKSLYFTEKHRRKRIFAYNLQEFIKNKNNNKQTRIKSELFKKHMIQKKRQSQLQQGTFWFFLFVYFSE